MAPPRVAPRQSLYADVPAQQAAQEPPPSSPGVYVEIALGYTYILLSLACSFYYVHLVTPYLANDLRLRGFNRTGGLSFLVDLANAHVLVPMLDVTPWAIIDQGFVKDYSADATPLMIQPAHARRMLLEDTRIEAAIARMLQASSASLVKLPTQYCWVDFERRWELAHTKRRQARCRQRDADNAAVYLESTLRIADWAQWQVHVGRPFNDAIVPGLVPRDLGEAWLRSVSCTTVVDVDLESAYWRRRGMTRYTLQWQNYQQDGLDEFVIVHNMFSDHPIRVKRIQAFAQQDVRWSSWVANWGAWSEWGLANRLTARNVSLVTTPNSSFTSVQDTNFVVAIDFDDQFQTPTARLVQSILGPFLSIDMRYHPLPLELVTFYEIFLETMLPVWRQPGHLALPDTKLTPIPAAWTFDSVTYYGGNPFCLGSPAFFQLNFGFDRSCAEVFSYALQLDRTSVLFALAATNASEVNVQKACALCGATTGLCLSYVRAAIEVLAPLDFQRAVAVQASVLESVGFIGIIQIAKLAQNSTTRSLLHHAVVDASSHWSFFGWVMLYDWLRGYREVISLEGDVSTLTLISSRYVPITFEASAKDIPASTGLTMWCILQYISLVLSGIAALVAVYSTLNRFSVIGRNLFRFNRVAGCVWIGRPLLLMRGLSAVLLLSASNFDLQAANGGTYLTPHNRTWFETMVVCGEALWLVYVVQDILLVFKHEAHWIGPLASMSSWVVMVLIDVISPYELSADASRNCVATAGGHSCTLGTIYVSSSRRVYVTLAVMATAIVASLCVGKVRTALSKNPPETNNPIATLLLPAAIEAFLDVPLQTKAGAQTMDTITCVLAGLFPLVRVGHTHLFDVKLWRYVSCDLIAQLVHVRSPTFTPVNGPSNAPSKGPRHDDLVQVTSNSRRRWLHRVQVGVGFVYMTATLVTSVSFVQLSTASVGNDLFWDGFNSSGTHTFLANWLNLALLVPGASNVLVLDYIDTYLYNSTDASIRFAPLYANVAQYDDRRNVSIAIAGLRRMRGIDALWISTQYCWLDFNQMWEMANSATRQARCLNMRDNGAVYFESILRNVPWDEWASVARAPLRWLDAFDVAFVADLNRTIQGRSWWTQLQSHGLSVPDEARWWRHHGILEYTTQWQNYKTLGIADSFSVENAMGLSYALTLKQSNGTYRGAYQTSLKVGMPLSLHLTTILANTSRAFGCSLLRKSAKFAYRNNTVSQVMQVSPPAYLTAVMNNYVGPFGSIDAKHVPRPPSLMALYRRIALITMERTMLSPASRELYLSIPDMTWPLKGHESWEGTSRLIEGGDFLCGVQMATGYLASHGCMESLGLTEGCSSKPASLNVDRSMLLFAYLAWSSVYRASSLDTTYVCSGRHADSRCPQAVAAARNLSAGVNVSAHDAFDDVMALQVGLTQFTIVNKSRWFLFLPMMNPPQRQFDFFGWLLLHEWVMGHRDVVRFEGDRGYLTVMSAKYPETTWHTNEAEVPRHIVCFLKFGIAYVTTILAFVASLVLVYTIVSRGNIEPRNFVHFNRVAGYVWVGRPLLFARSIVALIILSTSKAQLVRLNGFNVMQLPEAGALYYVRTVLSSSEACWLVYVLQDVLSILTPESTQMHPGHASFVVWAVSAVLSCVYPVQPHVTVQRHCTYEAVDLQMACHSGTIAIGDSQRLGLLVLIVVASVLSCASLQWLWFKLVSSPPRPSQSSSLFLCNGAKTFFRNQHHWTLDQVCYLDMASAVLNGLVVLTWRRTYYVLDIKTWRLFSVEAPQFHPDAAVPERFRRSLCLTE